MGLLDKPTVREEVLTIRMGRLIAKDKKEKMRRFGLKPNGTEITKKKYMNGKRTRNSFVKNMPKTLRDEWGQRMQHIRSI